MGRYKAMTTKYSAARRICVTTIFLTSFTSLVVGCQPHPHGRRSYIRPDIAGSLKFTRLGETPPQVTTLWQSGSLRLQTDLQRTQNLRLFDKGQLLVMVSFWADTPLAQELSENPRTLIYEIPPAPGRGHALVEIETSAELDDLARAAHQSHYFGCGNIEVISGIPLTSVTSFSDAVYAETVALAEVQSLLTKVDAPRLRNDMVSLESLGTRYHTTPSGLSTPAAVKSMFEQAGAGIPGFQVTLFEHAPMRRTSQASVIAVIPASIATGGTGTSGSDTGDSTVIFGSHLDSINRAGSGSPAPGADDNASGVATLVEAVRVLAASGASFKRRVEFHAYAAEEVGLVGSSEIAQSYADAGRQVAAMLQVDMNAYAGDGVSKTIYLVSTDTSATLRRSLKDLLTTYLGGDFAELELAGGTSDHKSWTNRGFPAVFPFEHPDHYNKSLHTEKDTSATASNSGLSARFAQLIIAFAAHQAGLKSAEASYASHLAAGMTPGAHAEDLALAIVNEASVNLGNQLTGEDFYQVGIGAPQEVTTVEYCIVEASEGPCTSDLYSADPYTRASAGSSAAAGRSLFLDQESILLSGSPLLRLSGYDATNKKIAGRTVRLQKK